MSHYYTNDFVLVQQFHIPKNEDRYKEIIDTLHRNVKCGQFIKIVLLNERLYTPQEMGFENEVPSIVVQVIIEKRLDYYTAFQFAKQRISNAWLVLSNNDIFFNSSLKRNAKKLLQKQRPRHKPKCATLLRWELNETSPYLWNHPKQILKSMSQDTWILYVDDLIQIPKSTKFNLGMPGCDNRIAYILQKEMGFSCLNHPFKIISLHNHASQIRNYNHTTIPIGGIYCFIHPII